MTEIAFGTYSCHGDLEPLLKEALKIGCQIFDTAPNYRHGMAQKELGISLKGTHQNIRILSKVGFFEQEKARYLLKEGLITEGEASLGHSLNAKYLKFQILQNVEELQVPCLDTLFLHNPERLFTSQDQTRIYQILEEAFEILENFCAQGIIKQYGIATWSGFEKKDSAFLNLEDLFSNVQKVSNNHHFKALQLPLSMVKFQPLLDYFEKKGPLWFARKNALEVFGSSPLHEGQLPPLISLSLLRLIDASLTPAQACLLFAKSFPNVTAILTSPSSLLQAEKNFEVTSLESLSEKRLYDLVTLLQQKK